MPLNSLFNPLAANPGDAGLMNLAMRLLANSGWSSTPTTFGQGLGQAGLGTMQDMIQQNMLREKMAQQQAGPETRFGTYNPRDYTAKSWAEFAQTRDPSLLKRYTEKTIMIGGVPHQLIPGTENQYIPLSTLGKETGAAAQKQEAITRAREQTKALVNKQVEQMGRQESIPEAINAYNYLKDRDLGKIYGYGESVYPDFLRSQEGVTMQAYRQQLVNMLTLAGRGQLKGQGQVTESEQKVVADAASILGNPNIAPSEARNALDRAMNILLRSAGMETPQSPAPSKAVRVYDPATGEFR